LDRMRFYLDCGSCESSRDHFGLEGGDVSKLSLRRSAKPRRPASDVRQ